MKKIVILVALTFIFGSSSLVFAEDYSHGDEIELIVDGELREGVIWDLPNKDGTPAKESIAKPDVRIISNLFKSVSSTPKVTESDVWQVSLKGDHGPEWCAKGYVNMTKDGRPFYHYTESRLYHASGMPEYTRGKRWGTGKVWATTAAALQPGTARVFYGW